jgi:hypothetical protein
MVKHPELIREEVASPGGPALKRSLNEPRVGAGVYAFLGIYELVM